MSRHTTLLHTIGAALAAAALLASPAAARPVDAAKPAERSTSSLAGTVSPRQDWRGEFAKDAARAAEIENTTGRPAPVFRTAPAPVEHKTAPAAPTGNAGDTWLVLGIALAGAGIVAGGAAGAARTHRLRAGRAAA